MEMVFVIKKSGVSVGVGVSVDLISITLADQLSYAVCCIFACFHVSPYIRMLIQINSHYELKYHHVSDKQTNAHTTQTQ